MDLEKLFILVIGLFIGGGFLLSGALMYGGQVNTGPSGGSQADRPELPSKNFMASGSNLTEQEQTYLAYQNDVVFINAFYTSEGEKQDLKELRNITQMYNQRVYMALENGNTSIMAAKYGLNEFPSAVAIGSNARNPKAVISNVSRASIGDAVCSVMRTWGTLSSKCSQ